MATARIRLWGSCIDREEPCKATERGRTPAAAQWGLDQRSRRTARGTTLEQVVRTMLLNLPTSLRYMQCSAPGERDI